MRPNKVKRALMKGEVQIGTWVNALRTPQIAQMIATAGFDFMYIDMEHSSFSIETAGDLCFAALAAGLVPIVRPAAKEPHLLTRPLDNGAMGLLKIPGLLVQDVASAKKWIAKGIRLVPYANEVSLLVNAGARAVGEIRGFSKGGG